MAIPCVDDVLLLGGNADATHPSSSSANSTPDDDAGLPESHQISHHHRESLTGRDIMPPLIMPCSLPSSHLNPAFETPSSSPSSLPAGTPRPMSQRRGHRRSNAISIPSNSTFLIPRRPAPPIPQGRRPCLLKLSIPSPAAPFSSRPTLPFPSPPLKTSHPRAPSSAGSVTSCTSSTSSSSLLYDDAITAMYTSFPKKRDFDDLNARSSMDSDNAEHASTEEEADDDEAMDLDFWSFLQQPLMVSRKC